MAEIDATYALGPEQPGAASDEERSDRDKGLKGGKYCLFLYSLMTLGIQYLILAGERAAQTVDFAIFTACFALMLRFPETLAAAISAVPFLGIFSYRGKTALVVLIALMGCAFAWRLRKRINSLFNLPLALVIIFFGYVAANWYFSDQSVTETGLGNLKLFFIRGITPAVLIATLTPARESFRRFLAALGVFSLFTAMLIFAADFKLGKISNMLWGRGGRIGLFGLDPISISLPLGLAGVVFAHYVLKARSVKVKIAALLASCLAFYAVFPTGTRQTLLCMAIAILAYALLVYRSYFGKVFWVVAMLVILLTGFLSITGNYHTQRFDIGTKGYFQDESFLGRITTMKRGLDTFATAPFLGVGAGGHGKYIYTINPYTHERVKDKEHIHNLFVELLAEQGLVGFLLFLAPLAIALVRITKTLRSTGNDEFRSLAAVVMALMVFTLIQANISGSLAVSGSVIVMLVAWMSILARETAPSPAPSRNGPAGGCAPPLEEERVSNG